MEKEVLSIRISSTILDEVKKYQKLHRMISGYPISKVNAIERLLCVGIEHEANHLKDWYNYRAEVDHEFEDNPEINELLDNLDAFGAVWMEMMAEEDEQ